MRAIVAQSQAVDSAAATAELLEQADERLAGEQPRAAFLFASTDYDHGVLLAGIQQRWPGLPLIGGSTDGEVSSVSGFVHDSALLTLLCGDDLKVHAGVGHDLSKDLDAAIAAALPEAAVPGFSAAHGRQLLCFTVFAPSANSTEVVRRLQQRLGADCPIFGGLTGDHREYARMVEFCCAEAQRDSLPVLLIEGDLKVSWGIGTGWFPVGEAMRVTRAEQHVVHEIAGRPAFEVFRDYWGSMPEDSLGEYPLAVYPEGSDGRYFLRAVLGADAATGSIRLAGEVPHGSTIRLTEVLPEGILSGSESAALAAAGSYPGTAPQLALVFTCAARKWVLGTEAERESALLQQAFARGGVQPAMAGFYAFGEIAPTTAESPSDFHNETCVAVLIGQ
ncbi:MAG: FIST signal transduction protein [Planctomycetota bacterium]